MQAERAALLLPRPLLNVLRERQRAIKLDSNIVETVCNDAAHDPVSMVRDQKSIT